MFRNYTATCSRLFNLGLCLGLLACGGLNSNVFADSSSSSSSSENCAFTSSTTPLELASALETTFWTNVQNGDITALTESISHIFQGGSSQPNPDLVYDKNAKLAQLASTNLTVFAISDIIAERSDDGKVLTVSYHLHAEGTYNDIGPIPFVTDNRIFDTWKLTNDHCQWKLVQSNITVLLPLIP